MLPWDLLVTGLSGPIERYDLATLRFTRDGGPHQADRAHQRALFTIVGALVVSAGHIEAEMKRIVLVHRGDPDSGFADVDDTWTSLERELRAIADGDGPLADPLGEALSWGEANRIKEIRDTAVHSSWCLYDLGHMHASRFKRKSDGQTRLASYQEVAEFVTTLREYANRLQRIVKWPVALLPPLPDRVPIVELTVDIEAE